jgi:hypothetical protein
VLPTLKDREAARQRRLEQLALAERTKRDAEIERERLANVALYEKADKLLEGLSRSIIYAIEHGKKHCYVRFGESRPHTGFKPTEMELKLAQIICDKIIAESDDYVLNLFSVETHSYTDTGYGCDREEHCYFPSVRGEWK